MTYHEEACCGIRHIKEDTTYTMAATFKKLLKIRRYSSVRYLSLYLPMAVMDQGPGKRNKEASAAYQHLAHLEKEKVKQQS